jgi:hypothetical protein
LAVVYTLYQGSPATISGSTLAPTGAGVVIIFANQPGNNVYAAAPVVAQDFSVTSP